MVAEGGGGLITPTKLIYNAYRRTPQPMPLPNGKTATWPEPEYIDVPDPVCWLCGGDTGGRGMLRKNAIRKTFTNTPDARAADSSSVCVACSWILEQKLLRNYSLLVLDGLLEHPSRERIRDIVISPPDRFPWMLCIAVSGQKHLSFFGHVNLSRRDMRIYMENMTIPLPAGGLGHLIEPVEKLYNGGFSKAEILSGDYRQDRILKFGLQAWRELVEQLAPVRGSRQYELAVFVAQKREEENLSSTVSTQTTSTQQQPHSVSTPFIAAVTPSDSKSPRIFGESSSGQPDQQQNEQQLSLFG